MDSLSPSSRLPTSPRAGDGTGLGQLEWHGDKWHGTVEHQGHPVALTIAGPATGPDARLARAAETALLNLHAIVEEAVALLGHDHPHLVEPGCSGTLRLACITFPRVESPDEFWLDLEVPSDRDGIWRVEFGPVPG